MKNATIFTLFLAFLSVQSIFGQDVHAKNIATIRKAYDALNHRHWAAFSAQCAPGYTEQNVSPMPVTGLNAAIDLYKQFMVAFPDFTVKINEIAPLSPTRYLVLVTVTGTSSIDWTAQT